MSENNAIHIPPVESLVTALNNGYEDMLVRGRATYPRKNPILSDIGECDRQIVLSVTNWKDRPPPSVDLLGRFRAGNVWEREMVKDLLETGFDFIGGQQTITVHGKGGILLATGRIDGFVKWKGEKIPCEFKSMNPNVYNSVDTVDDFVKKPWLRKYLRQLQLYMFGEGKEYGLFGLTNCLGSKKWFVLYLDLGECEFLLQRLEKVHAHLKAKTLPDRIEYKGELCGSCPFAQICLPDIDRSEAVILTEDSTLADLDRRGALKPARDEYEALDKGLKKGLKGIESGIAGNWVIIGKERHRDGYAVGPSDFWETRIRPVGRKV